ncbi:MAG TPA: hypothetical protein VEW94_06545 [Chloroflexia bacterium]|nr:hypothetical protein [Chloroflexia bacterium]
MKQTEIRRLLPGVFQRTIYPGNPLSALLDVMEALHAPSEEVLAGLDAFFDPRRSPGDFVPMLATWVDLERLLTGDPEEVTAGTPPPFPSGTGRLRELVAAAPLISKWRGTARGLLLFLETATGAQGFIIDERVPGLDGLPRPFHLRVVAPAETARYMIMIERIIELEKPAYVTYQLEFAE